MRKPFVFAALLIIAFSTVCHAGPLRRIGDASRALLSRGDATVGTVMAIAQVDGSQQTAVLVLDTVVQMSIGCYVIPVDDQRRFHRKVTIGSTFEAISFVGGSIEIGELSCSIARRWKARKDGNPTRREFLTGERGFLGPIMAYAMRGRPLAAEHFFPGGVAFAGVAADLPDLIDTLAHFGYDLSPIKDAIEVHSSDKLFGHDKDLLQCRSVLRTAGYALQGLGPVAADISSSNPGHHGETEAFQAASDAYDLVQEFFDQE